MSENRKDANDQVQFITSASLAPGSVELHKGDSSLRLTRSLEEVSADWQNASRQVLKMVAASETEATDSGFEISEVTVGLGFNAKGKLGFLAEAGMEASVEITLKRRK